MKVKELIEHLQTLDPEKGIWVRYDGYAFFPPIPSEFAEEDDVSEEKGIKEGDYIIPAW